jgi:hypothetical protein
MNLIQGTVIGMVGPVSVAVFLSRFDFSSRWLEDVTFASNVTCVYGRGTVHLTETNSLLMRS